MYKTYTAVLMLRTVYGICLSFPIGITSDFFETSKIQITRLKQAFPPHTHTMAKNKHFILQLRKYVYFPGVVNVLLYLRTK
jgi:hypothetical protein